VQLPCYWGGADCPDSAVPTGCNGNGDKQIFNADNNGEFFRAWQHLAYAGLVEGSFTGEEAGGGLYAVIGTNVPETSISGVKIVARYDGVVDGFDNPNSPINGNGFGIGANNPATANPFARGAFLTVAEAAAIDAKVDDGTVNFGKWLPNGNSCVTGTSPNSTFQLSQTGIICYFQYKLGI